MSGGEWLDGKSLMDLLFMASAQKKGDKKAVKLMKIFNKYGLSVTDGLALLLELNSVNEGKDDEI